MDSSHIQLQGSGIDSIRLTDGTLTVSFAQASIIRTMTGSRERTRWWQAGALRLEGVEGADFELAGPLECAGGEIEENLYTYMDMIPIPFSSRGRIRCTLHLQGQTEPLCLAGVAAELLMLDVPRYIEHLRP